MGGRFNQSQRPTEDVLMWVYGGISELGKLGNTEFARNINIKHMLEVRTDGRASKHVKKTLEGIPYNANQMSFIFKHSPGFQHEISLTLELYKE